jgi:hypothetical protein
MGAAQQMTALPSWMYGSPLDIIDGQRALALKQSKKRTVEPVRAPRDRYYTQSRSVHIKAVVKDRIMNGGSR